MRILKLIKRMIYCRIKHINKAEYALVTGGGKLGQNCEIYSSVVFGSEPYLIEIGNNCRITEGVKFVTHDGGLWVLRNLYPELKNADYFGKIKIGNNVHIGWNSIIMPGVEIGENSIVGCGSVVTKNVPANSVACGIPARVIETIDEYYDKKKAVVVMTKNLNAADKRKRLGSQFNVGGGWCTRIVKNSLLGEAA